MTSTLATTTNNGPSTLSDGRDISSLTVPQLKEAILALDETGSTSGRKADNVAELKRLRGHELANHPSVKRPHIDDEPALHPEEEGGEGDDEEEEGGRSDSSEDEDHGLQESLRLLHEATVADEDPASGYEFHFQLSKHYEFYPRQLSFKGQVLYKSNPPEDGRAEEPSTPRAQVGKLRGSLIDRGKKPFNFHQLCDADSSELQAIGCKFCDRRGRVRYENVDGLEVEGDPDGAADLNRGGFVHLYLVELDQEHWGSDVGLRFCRALLTYLATAPPAHARPGWSLAVVEPGLVPTAEERFEEMGRSIRGYGERGGDEEAPPSAEEAAEEEAKKSRKTAALRKVRLQFARLGFRQASFGSDYWYLVPSRLTGRRPAPPEPSKAQVAHLEITLLPEAPAPHPLDDFLVKTIEGLAQSLARFDQVAIRAEWHELAPVLQKSTLGGIVLGGDLVRCKLLHRAVANRITAPGILNMIVECHAASLANRTAETIPHDGQGPGGVVVPYELDVGLYQWFRSLRFPLQLADSPEEIRRGIVDLPDHLGNTPLHCAAAGLDPGAVRCVLGLGSQALTARNLFGKTPFDMCAAAWQDREDMRGTFGIADGFGHAQGRDSQGPVYECLGLLLNPSWPPLVCDGALTPRMLRRLQSLAEVAADECLGPHSLIPSESEETDPSSVEGPGMDEGYSIYCMIPWWRHLPAQVQGGGGPVLRSVAVGFGQVIDAVNTLLADDANDDSSMPQATAAGGGPQLPTVERVARLLEDGGGTWASSAAERHGAYDPDCTTRFFSAGGKIEHALDGLVCEARDTSEFPREGGDGSVLEWVELDELPSHPLDHDFDFLRYMLLGPRGNVKAGPFYLD